MKTRLILLFLLCISIIACKEDKKPAPILANPMEEIDTICIKPSLMREIRKYMNEHDSCNTFLLFPTYLFRSHKTSQCDPYDNKDNEIFSIVVVGPNSFGESEWAVVYHYPHRYFRINDKYIFISSRDDQFYNQAELASQYDSLEFRGYDYSIYDRWLIVYNNDSCVSVDSPNDDHKHNYHEVFRKIIPFTIPEK